MGLFWQVASLQEAVRAAELDARQHAQQV